MTAAVLAGGFRFAGALPLALRAVFVNFLAMSWCWKQRARRGEVPGGLRQFWMVVISLPDSGPRVNRKVGPLVREAILPAKVAGDRDIVARAGDQNGHEKP